MPNRNGTGPFGDGRPGRGLGPCGRFINYFIGNRRDMRNYPMRRQRRFIDYVLPFFSSESRDVYPYDSSNLLSRKKDLEDELKWVDQQIGDVEKEKK